MPLLTLRPPSPILTSLLAFLFLAFLWWCTGSDGSRDPLANPLPLTIWNAMVGGLHAGHRGARQCVGLT